MAARILVVDDDLNGRTGLGRILEKLGYEVTVAESGDQALSLLHEASFNLVVTDLKMVGANGIEVLRAVKQSHPDTETILLTAYGTIESAVEAMKFDAYDYLTKPVVNHRRVRDRQGTCGPRHSCRQSPRRRPLRDRQLRRVA